MKLGLAVLLVLMLAPAAHAANDRFLVRTGNGPTRFGHFTESFTAKRPAPVKLRNQYGAPTSSRKLFDGAVCKQTWAPFKMTVRFGVFGTDTSDPCKRGAFLDANLDAHRWHTASGVRPGGRAGTARQAAVKPCRPTKCVLATHISDCAGGPVPSVVAKLQGNRVTRLKVFSLGCE